mgnify:CR=1 FL=1
MPIIKKREIFGAFPAENKNGEQGEKNRQRGVNGTSDGLIDT